MKCKTCGDAGEVTRIDSLYGYVRIPCPDCKPESPVPVAEKSMGTAFIDGNAERTVVSHVAEKPESTAETITDGKRHDQPAFGYKAANTRTFHVQKPSPESLHGQDGVSQASCQSRSNPAREALPVNKRGSEADGRKMGSTRCKFCGWAECICDYKVFKYIQEKLHTDNPAEMISWIEKHLDSVCHPSKFETIEEQNCSDLRILSGKIDGDTGFCLKFKEFVNAGGFGKIQCFGCKRNGVKMHSL